MGKYIFFILFAVFFLSHCNKKELEKQDLAALQSILEENQKVHSFLFKEDFKIPEISSLIKTIDNIQAQDPDFAVKLGEMKTSLSKIVAADRKNFIIGYSLFSEVLAQTLKLYSLTSEYNHFYCPMEEKSWVSKGFAIQNPYSPEMRDCGEVLQK